MSASVLLLTVTTRPTWLKCDRPLLLPEGLSDGKVFLQQCSNQDVAKSLSDTIMDALSQLDGAEDSTPGAGGGAEAEAV